MSVPFEKELENALIGFEHGPLCTSAALNPVTMKYENKCHRCECEATLLPLLQAGQAMRDLETRKYLANAWDAARERLAQLEKR